MDPQYVKQPDTDTDVFQQDAPAFAPVNAPGEIIIGTIAGIDAQGQPRVDYPQNPSGQPSVAMTTLGITVAHVGRNVALLFANGDPHRPVILGLIHSPLHDLILSYGAKSHEQPPEELPASPALKVDNITIDGKRIVLEGTEEIVLQCGAASITLTQAGKILIRGNYVLNHAGGINRITGGSVQVN